MLALTRKVGEALIFIDTETKKEIEVYVVKFADGSVRLSMKAPDDVLIFRDEHMAEIQEVRDKLAAGEPVPTPYHSANKEVLA